MALQKINLGATVGDKTGDGARTAGAKINDNFDYLEDKIENRNKVVFNAGLTQDGNEILINAGWEWLINGVLYTNPVPVLIDIPVAAAGLSRIDNIVATTSNTFARSEGTESETPVAPIFVPGTIVVAFALVNDTALQDSGNVDPEKLDRAGYNGTAATLDQKIDGTREDVMTRIDDAFETIEQVDAKINNHFKGVYLTEAALIAAHPTASVGDYAQVNQVGATKVVNYNWDAESNLWVKNVTEGGSGANNTDELPEGTTNLYFTVTRFLANLTYANIIAALGFTPSQAPNNAQKNSDITKAEIEAKLTGEITSHTHPNSGGGDMTTTTDQTVSGIKTYLAGKLGLRNVANTFTSFFSNANTASRTYTLQNKDGVVAHTDDTAVVPLDEGNGVGWVINGRVAANYGPVGLKAVDLSFSDTASNVFGAVGNYSVANGYRSSASGVFSTVSGGSVNTASGSFSVVGGGYGNTASGNLSTVIGGDGNQATAQYSLVAGGSGNKSTGSYAVVYGGIVNLASGAQSAIIGGENNFARSFGEFVCGLFGTDYTPFSATGWNALDRIFNIGNGQATGRSNAFTILKNGLATLPSVNNTLINAESTGKAIVTKEYVNRTFTVANLPAPASGVAYATVTDALAPTYLSPVMGGGNVVCPVFYNGSAWVAH